MNFLPCNRNVLLEREDLAEEEKDQMCVLVPEDYKIEPVHACYSILDYAEDCNISFAHGDKVVVLNSMIEKIEVEGEQFLIVLENYVVGYYDGGVDE